MESPEGNLWVEAPFESADALLQRLTRYLIADDVEVADLTGNFRLLHFIGPSLAPPAGVIIRETRRFGVPGTDWWFPAGSEAIIPEGTNCLEGDALEDFRIRHGVPRWGRELVEGLLPPEAGLDATDISYCKGCYIGQEVISRIKHAGKVNKRLVKLNVPATCADDMRLLDGDGHVAGEITSLSPIAINGQRAALAYLRRGIEAIFPGGHEVRANPV
jgi:folate-binding protein YgfZ